MSRKEDVMPTTTFIHNEYPRLRARFRPSTIERHEVR
jgi:hypothetical protein